MNERHRSKQLAATNPQCTGYTAEILQRMSPIHDARWNVLPHRARRTYARYASRLSLGTKVRVDDMTAGHRLQHRAYMYSKHL